MEGVSVNMIAQGLAATLSDALGLPLDKDIVQVTRAGHTGSSGWKRLGSPALFAGAVEPGRGYWLVDDFIGQGGTLANLRGYLLAKGGAFAGTTVLTGKPYSAILGLSVETLAQLRRKHGKLEQWWRERFGFGLESLTDSEARYLLRAEDADTIRARLADAE